MSKMTSIFRACLLSSALSAVLIAAAVKSVNATTGPHTFSWRGKNVDISIIQNNTPSPISDLYYKSLLGNLDDFADELRQNGKLGKGKVRFDIYNCTWDVKTGVKMYKYNDVYYCLLNGVEQIITQDYLTKIIAYFASDKWESFTYDETKIEDPAVAIKMFNRKLDPIMGLRVYASQKVLDAGNGIAVYFEKEKLICKGANKVYGVINHWIPFSAGSKTFITVGDTISAVEKGAVVNRYKLTEDDFGDGDELMPPPSQEVHSEWVNFSYYGSCILSYSIKKNKFYNASEMEAEKEKSAEREWVKEEANDPKVNYGALADSRDGKKYKTVKIGDNTWMAENMNHKSATGESWCNDDAESNCAKYGRLYDWLAAQTVCPAGWRLSSRADWDYLGKAAGGYAAGLDKRGEMATDVNNLTGNFGWFGVGTKLRAKSGWKNSDKSVTNTDDYGFSALPGGNRYYSGGGFHYYNEGNAGTWWATDNDNVGAYFQFIDADKDRVRGDKPGNLSSGFSVRCVQGSKK
jgi:uncharacterized protein (TIGR02145 family)